MERWNDNMDGEDGADSWIWWVVPLVLIGFALLSRI